MNFYQNWKYLNQSYFLSEELGINNCSCSRSIRALEPLEPTLEAWESALGPALVEQVVEPSVEPAPVALLPSLAAAAVAPEASEVIQSK